MALINATTFPPVFKKVFTAIEVILHVHLHAKKTSLSTGEPYRFNDPQNYNCEEGTRRPHIVGAIFVFRIVHKSDVSIPILQIAISTIFGFSPVHIESVVTHTFVPNVLCYIIYFHGGEEM